MGYADPTQSASLRTGVNKMMTRFDTRRPIWRERQVTNIRGGDLLPDPLCLAARRVDPS